MKRFIITVLISALLLQNVSAPLLSQASEVTEETTTENTLTETSSVISEELQEAFLTEAESYRVMIWLEEIDYDKVEAMAEKATATTWEEIESYEKQVYSEAVTEVARAEMEDADVMTATTLRTEEEIMADSYAEVLAVADEELKLVAEEVDSFIMAKRAASTALYAENNKAIASNSIIKENIEFVSRYSPMVIAELSREQIEAIALEDGVVGVYLTGNEKHTVESDFLDFSVDEENIKYSSTVNDYDSYLDYIYASRAHALGFTGQGVKVGMVDFQWVYASDHAELVSADITRVGTVYNEDNHAVEMARVICGEYGVAPDCKLYSTCVTQYQSTYLANIESLLDNGVSVINMSLGSLREGKTNYTVEEMWIDHITTSHSVVVVVSAGNSTGDKRIHEPALAYNVITVANVNCYNDSLHTTSCYDNGTGGVKPDVASAGANVFGNINGGTSSAAATVTGMIAILLEVKPTLANYPIIMKAIVIASADHVAGSSTYASGYDDEQGAGVVNVFRAMNIISYGQYYGGYASADGTTTLTKTVASGLNKTTFVYVGNKMNIATGNHGENEYNNQAMPEMTLVVLSTSGSLIGYNNVSNSSVELVRSTYQSSVKLNLVVSGIGTRGMAYAIAWY